MTLEFWKAALIRAIRTAAQSALGMIGTGAIGIVDADWLNVLSVSAMGAVVSILTSIATGLPECSHKEDDIG